MKQYKYRSKLIFDKSDYQIIRQKLFRFLFHNFEISPYLIINIQILHNLEENSAIFCKNLTESQSTIYDRLLLLSARFSSPAELHENRLNLM